MLKMILIAMLAAVSLALAACTPETTDPSGEDTPDPTPIEEVEEAEKPEEESAEDPDACEDDCGEAGPGLQAPDFDPEEMVYYKPVIYLYPEEETAVSVSLDYDGRLTCTYPAYEDGWRVTASPDGTLTDEAGQTYRYLYWEGAGDMEPDFSAGFSVAGCDTAAFLEDTLAKLGLNRAEANEFIVFWLPQMQENEYNLISFQTENYTDRARLSVEPAPDTVIRVFMAWKEIPAPVNLPPQELTAPERTGFAAVEWGGTCVK